MNVLPSGSQQEEQPQAPINPVVPNWAGPPVVPVQPFPDLRMLQNWITQSMIQYNAVGSQQIAATNDQAGVLKRDAVGGMTWDPSGGGGAVTSVFGRTAAVIAQSGDYTPAQVGAEPALGNPGSSGMVLTSTTGGVRSWVTAMSLAVLTFYGFDDFSSYADGPLDAPGGGFSWGGIGAVTMPDNMGYDDLKSYANGALDAPNGGVNWGAAGAVTVPN